MEKSRILYHYTSMEGICGILSGQSVWMSDCRYLNDRKELRDAVDSFIDKYEGEKRIALELAFHWWQYSRCHCVFSLSESPQILSQWRAYSADGTGMALGFSEKFMTAGWCERDAKLVDCVYDDHNQFLDLVSENLAQEIEKIFGIYEVSKHAVNIFWEEIEKETSPLDTLYAQLLRVKNIAFKEEREVRLVKSVPFREAKTRVSSGVAIPFIKNKLWRDNDKSAVYVLIPEVWLGPRCDVRNAHWLSFHQQLGWTIGGIKKFDCGYC